MIKNIESSQCPPELKVVSSNLAGHATKFLIISKPYSRKPIPEQTHFS